MTGPTTMTSRSELNATIHYVAEKMRGMVDDCQHGCGEIDDDHPSAVYRRRPAPQPCDICETALECASELDDLLEEA